MGDDADRGSRIFKTCFFFQGRNSIAIFGSQCSIGSLGQKLSEHRFISNKATRFKFERTNCILKETVFQKSKEIKAQD